MENVLNISNFEDGNRIKQGDLSEIRYVLLDTNHDDLNLTGKGAVVYLINKQSEVIYQKALTVVKHDEKPMVTLTIDDVIPAGTYTLEIVVDNKYIFPSDTKEKIEVVDSVLGKAFKKVSENNLYGEIIDYGLSNGKFDTLKGEKGDSITITHKYIDEDGNTFVQFSDGTNIIVHKGQQGESLQIQSKKVNEDGDIDLVFSDGTRVNIPKGIDGRSFTYDDLTDEQKADLVSFVPVKDNHIVNAVKNDFLEGKGQLGYILIESPDDKVPINLIIFYDTSKKGMDLYDNTNEYKRVMENFVDEYIYYDLKNKREDFTLDGFINMLTADERGEIREMVPPKLDLHVKLLADGQTYIYPAVSSFTNHGGIIEALVNNYGIIQASYKFNDKPVEEYKLVIGK